jgi:galactoside O-acetyltransferase
MRRSVELISIALNPIYWSRRLYSFVWRLRLKSCGTRFNVRYPLVVTGVGRITIGNGFSAMGHNYLYANDGGELIIGNYCSLNTNVQIGAASGRVVIGNNVIIAPNVVIRAANHGMDRHTEMRNQPHIFGEIVIKDDVWIASNAVITSGVVLEVGTIVAAGAVVTKSTQPYEIVGGVPAKVIGERR